LVSLLAKWTHIAVPSKAMSSVCAGGTILFCGSKEADTWALLQEAGWHIEESADIDSQVRLFLSQITLNEVLKKKIVVNQVANNLKTMLTQGI
jgi:hypothetical protein